MTASILIVDDEKNTREGLQSALSLDYDVAIAANVDEALRLMNVETFDIILTDLRMGSQSGMSLLEKVKSDFPHTSCIMMTAYGNITTAVEAMKKGASDFITKPIDLGLLNAIISRTLKNKKDFSSSAVTAETAPKAITKNSKISTNLKIISESKAMQEALIMSEKVAASKATVLITGETGTGKELVAKFIHDNSPRKDEPFVALHCAAIPATLLESEIFGYEKGAFTGANQRKIGKFESADKGTIFLDEIGEIDAPTQVKILRFLETKSFERLGSVKSTNIDVRLICATNKDLKALVAEGSFREDLFYRLNVVQIKLSALRERKEDIEPMLMHYLNYFAEENSLPKIEVTKKAMNVLINYSWPGNIRELRNFCESTVVMLSSKTLDVSDLDGRFFTENLPIVKSENSENSNTSTNLSDNEHSMILKALEQTKGHKSKAADLLGISRRTLHRKLNEKK